MVKKGEDPTDKRAVREEDEDSQLHQGCGGPGGGGHKVGEIVEA